MFENVEFWALLVTIIAGYVLEFKFIGDIKDRLSENSQRLTKLETETHMEFEKCRLHKSCMNAGVNSDE